MIFFTWDCVVEKKRAYTCHHRLEMSFEQNNGQREATTSVGEDTGRRIRVVNLNSEERVFDMDEQTTGNDLYQRVKASFGVKYFKLLDTTNALPLKNNTSAANLAPEYTLFIENTPELPQRWETQNLKNGSRVPCNRTALASTVANLFDA